MIYNVSNTTDVGRPVKSVFDANGLEYTGCTEIDTEEGIITRYILDENRKPTIDSYGNILRETLKVAKPILIIFRSKENE